MRAPPGANMEEVRMRLAKLALGAAVVALVSGPALAQSGADAIAARQGFMKLVGGNTSALKLAIDSGSADRLKQVEGNARAIAAAAGAIPAMFPKGSEKGGNTKALDKIWSDMDGFKKAAAGLATEATALAEALKAGDVEKAKSQFGRLGAVGCGGCHQPYRAK
jgi:cytochrome c556